MELTVTLTGYVGNDVEVRKTKTGVSATNFRVGTTPRIKRGDEWVNGTTTWTTVVCYRALADNVGACVTKGDPVIVEGRVRTQIWTDEHHELHERVVVEAVTIGHDLNRGTTVFQRNQRRVIDDLSLRDAEATVPAEEIDETDETEASALVDPADPVDEASLALVA